MRKFYITIFCLLAICRVIHAQGSGGSEDKNTFAYNNVVYKVDPDGATSPTQIQADDVSDIYGETHFFSKNSQVLDDLYDQDKAIFAGYDDLVPTLRLNSEQYNAKIILDWDAVTGATSYFIFRAGETDSEGTLMPIAMVSGATTTYEDVGLLFNASRTYYIRALIGTSSQPGYYLTEASNDVYGATSDLIYNVLVQNEYVIDHEVVLTVDLLQGLEQQAFHLTIDDQSNGDRVAEETYTLTDFTSPSLDLLEKKMVLNGSGDSGAYVTIPSYTAEDWTFEMYMKKEVEFPAESQRVLLSGTDFELVMTEEDVDGNTQATTLALYQSGTEQVRSETTLPTAAWTHLAVVKSGYQVSVYQGGHQVISHLLSVDPGVVQYVGKGDDPLGNVEQLSLAFARLWETARSNDQIVTDMLNIYQGTDYPAKLLDQWQFDQLGIDPVPGLKNTLELDLDSNDPGNSPVQWSDVFSISSYEKTVYYRQYVEPTSTHQYTLNLYETGNGEDLITKSTTDYTAAAIPAPQLFLQNTPSITRLRLKTTATAEQTKVIRTAVSSGEEYSAGSLGTDHYLSNYWTLDGSNCVYSGTDGTGNIMIYDGGSYYEGSDYSFVIRFKQTEANGEIQYLVNNWKYTHGVVNLYVDADNELQMRIETSESTLHNLGTITPDVWHEVLLTYQDLSDGSTVQDGNLTAYFDRQLSATHSYSGYPHRARLTVRAIGANTIDESTEVQNHIDYRREEFVGEIAYFGGIDEYFDESEIPLSDDLPGRYNGWEMHYLLQDAFVLAGDNTISGGMAYEYALAPYYEETQYEGSATVTTVNTTDLSLLASAGTDAITLIWDDAVVSSSFGTDTVYVLRDGEKIARLVGADTYDDTNPAPGTTHTYGVAPVVDGAIAFAHYAEAVVVTNGSVNGWLLSKKSDFVLENLEAEASATIDGQTYSLALLSDGDEGQFSASGVYYDREATYTLAEPAEAAFTLSQSANTVGDLFVPYDSIAAQVATDADVFIDFQNATDLSVNNINTLSWQTQDLWNGARVYTNVYRNEELIGIVVDTTGVTGNLVAYSDMTGNASEQYAYKLRSYCHGCIETGITTYKDTLIALTYPEMISVENLTATVTTGTVSESDLVQLDFNYPYEEVEALNIYRKAVDSDDAILIASIDEIADLVSDPTGAYQYVDITGIPLTDYEYWVEASIGNNTSKSNVVEIQYPVIDYRYTNNSLILSNETSAFGTSVRIADESNISATQNIDGFALLADGEVVQTIAITDMTTVIPMYAYFMKHYADQYSRPVSYSYAKYKQNEEGLFYFDEVDFLQTRYFDDGFGPVSSTSLPEKNIGTLVTGPGFYKVIWDVSGTTWEEGSAEYRVAIDNGSGTSVDVDPLIRSAAGEVPADGTGYIYDFDASGNELQRESFAINNSDNDGVDGFQPIENLQASDDLSEGVFVSWEYPDFADAKFEVYRDNVLIETVSAGTYHYYDQEVANINANEVYAYQVRAVYDEDGDGTNEWYSARATDAGMRRVRFVVRGHVYDTEGHGLAHAGINIRNVWARTDGAGYFELDQLYMADGDQVDLHLSVYDPATNDDQIQSVTLTLDENSPEIMHNFVVSDKNFDFGDEMDVAGAVALAAYPDENEFGVRLKVQMSNDNFDGVELYRSFKLIADISSYEDLNHVDTNGESGLEYEYTVLPYKINTEGIRDYGFAAKAETVYPSLLAPGYLVSELENGFVNLRFADKNDGRSYLITRIESNESGELDEVQIGEVTDGTGEYLDESGVALSTYFYKVYSAMEQDEYTATSEGYNFVSASFPLPKDVENLAGITDESANLVTLTWDIPEDADLFSLNLYENEKLIAFDDELPITFVDSTGTPGVINTYRLETFRSGSDIISSAGQSISVRYPDLPAISALVFNNDDSTMTTTVSWDYQVKTVDGFYLTITHNATGESFTKTIEATPGVTANQYVFETGISGAAYTYDISAFTDRNGTAHVTDVYSDTQSFPVLPTPTVEVVETEESYVLLGWNYENFDIESWHIKAEDVNQSTVLFEDAEVDPGLREYLFQLDSSSTFKFTIKAISSEGTDSQVGQWQGTVGSNLDEALQASQDEANQVTLGIVLGQNQNYTSVALYRDETEIERWDTVSGNSLTYVDTDANPGEYHLYKAEVTGSSSKTYAAQGLATGTSGEIIGQITTQTGQGVSGIPVQLTAFYDNRYLKYETTTMPDGNYAFNELILGSNEDPVAYTVEPVSEEREFEPASQVVYLSESFDSKGAAAIVDKSSFIVSGMLAYSWTNSLVPDLQVKLYGYDDEGNEEVLQFQETSGSTYSFAQTIDSNYEYYTVKLDADYHNDGDEQLYYYSYFAEDENGEVISDPILTSDLSPGSEINYSFEDQLAVPTTFSVGGLMGSLGDYKWHIRLQDEGGQIDTLLVTDNTGVLDVDLPPLNYSARVVSVDRFTAATEAILTYFKAEVIQLSHQDSLKVYTDGYSEDMKLSETEYIDDILNASDVFVEEANFVFHKVPRITIRSGFEDYLNTSCSDGDDLYNIPLLAAGEDRVTLTLDIQEEFAGQFGDVTEGHLLIINNTLVGDEKTVKLEYNEVKGWTADAFTPINVNVVNPYKQLIEFHYFNENGRYMTSTTQEVIVSGMRNLGDSDFITDPGSEYNFPLFVLRDPPGDASKATIEAGSSVKYSYTSKMAYSGSQSIKKEFGSSFFGIGNKFELSVGLDESSTFTDSYSFSLDFKESLSTSGGASFDPDRKAYQMSRESDIIVGIGTNLMYAAAREIDIDDDNQCMIDEDMVITVDLADIKTTWNYTVSEIERNISYYDNLVNDPKVVLENEGEEDGTDLKAEVETIKANWEKILIWHDKYNRAPANMCRLVAEIKSNYSSHTYEDEQHGTAQSKEWWQDGAVTTFTDFIHYQKLNDELDVLVDYCDNSKLFKGKQDNIRLKNDLTDWEDTDFEDYLGYMDEFQKLWAAYEVYNLHKKSNVLNYEGAFTNQGDYEALFELDDFSLVENRSFSSQAAYTQTFSSSKSVAETVAENLKASLGIDITSSFKTTTALATWGTLAAPGGIGVITKAPEFKTNVKYKAGLKFAAAFDFSQNSTEGESLKISYTLNDNDPGDHFNTWVLHDPTGYKYNTTPDFILTGGKSSCPYEEGTIPRDMPQIAPIDEEGNIYSTSFYNVEWKEGAYKTPVQITNLAPYYETRQWAIMPARDGNTEGVKFTLGQEILVESAPKEAIHMYGSDPTYQYIGFGNYASYNGYDFPDAHLIVGPKCEVQNGWVHPLVTDTITFNIHFRKDVSPVALAQGAGWFVNAEDVNGWTFGIEKYRLDTRQYDMEKIWLEYRDANEDNYSWTVMEDSEGNSELEKDFLQAYYDEYSNVYYQEYYPFVWNPDTDVVDGSYMVRAVITHPDGEVAYSSAVKGTIDRRKPRLKNLPAPTDEILSRGDVVSFTMDESIDCNLLYEDIENNATIVVRNIDGSDYRELTYHEDPAFSDYEFSCSGSGVDIIIKESVLSEIDGKDVEITVTGIEDRVGNKADDVVWGFRSDAFKYPVSNISLNKPVVLMINGNDTRDSINFVATNYEIYGNRSLLDEIVLQYRKLGTTYYQDYASLSIEQLRANYEVYSPDGSLAPEDVIPIALDDFEDGEYSFRLKAVAGESRRTSNKIKATFDRISPQIMNLSPDSRVVDWGDQIRITYSENMYDRDGLSFTAEIVRTDPITQQQTSEPYTGLQGFINSNWTGFTFNDINDPVLSQSFGDTLKITMLGVTDYYGNALLDDEIKFVIGNFAPNVTGVKLHDPQSWVMNTSVESTTFMAGDFDLYGTKGKDLDSLKLVYNPSGTSEFVEIASYTVYELQAIHDAGSNHAYAEPTVNITWDISSDTTLADGDYDVYAVAYGDNGKPNYSGSSSGTIDRTAPVYIGAYEPADGLVEATDYFMEFNFTEPVDMQTGTITVSEIVSGVPVAINESLYELYTSGNKLQIMPSESFRVIYAGDSVEINVNGIEDLYGNIMVDEFWQQFTMDENYSPPAGSRQLTDLDAERIETGEVAVSWTSYEFFDETLLERSRDGIHFTEIARYNGDIDSHLDEVNFSKLVFYRLKQTSDTTVYYSKTVAVETNNLIPLLATYTYPMPFDGSKFKLSVLTNNLEDEVRIQIMNTTGMVIGTHSIDAEKLNNLNVMIRLDEPLKPGIYHMQMVQGNKRSYQKLLVVN